MLKLILSRLLQGIIVLLIVSILTFWLLAAAGGDAVTSLANERSVRNERLEEQRHIYGLDQPLPVRYLHWLGSIARGEMGKSFFSDLPVWLEIRRALVNTLSLTAAALVMAWAIALILGSMAALRPRGWIDKLCGALILLASSTPRIVLALGALALAASTTLFSTSSGGERDSATDIILPAFVLAFPLVALFLAQVRDGLGAALREEFVQVARAKGLSERVVVLRHALRAALNPLITIFGYSLGGLIGGSVIVESVLNRKGLGELSVTAARRRDVPLMMGIVLVTATAVLVGNLIADILLRVNDPRLREDEARRNVSAKNITNAA